MNTVAIVGAGLIGRAWAVVFARAGWAVRVTDPSALVRDEAPALIRAECDALAGHGLLADAAGTAARVAVVGSTADALEGASFVQENGPEREDAKRAIFAELDRLAGPEVLLCSSTSAIVASAFTADLPGRARCLVGHPVNPPHLVPVVELCGAPWTDPGALARARDVYASIGQSPVTVRREIAGFVLNRLQGALLAEAFRLVEDGIVSPQDLDATVKDGLGLRWSFMGPFETIELNAPGGIADYCERYTGFLREAVTDPATPSVYDAANVARVTAEWGAEPTPARIAARTAWRNGRLAALAAHRAGQPRAPG